MTVGVGYCNDLDAFAAGKVAAQAAMETGQLDKASLVFAFRSGSDDHPEFVRGIRSVVGGDAPVVGGSAIGIITNSTISYEGCPSGVAILSGNGTSYRVAHAGGLDRDERLAGRTMAEQLAGVADSRLLLVFYDSVKNPPTAASPPVMNASPPLLAGIGEVMEPSIPIIGAGLLGDYGFQASSQFDGSDSVSQSVVGTVFAGETVPYFTIMHGCTPFDGAYHTVTRTDGALIFEIDGRPAVEVINEIYGGEEWQEQLPVRRLTIGVNSGKKYGDFQEDQYVNRLIAGVLPDKSGIVLFESDLEAGTEFQFMLRDSQAMIDSARENSRRLFSSISADGRSPRLAIYIDCAGRAAEYSETATEEADEIVQVANLHGVPLLGFYTGVEVAPLLGQSKGLDWTGVLLVLTDDA
jgi:hypothetical protein